MNAPISIVEGSRNKQLGVNLAVLVAAHIMLFSGSMKGAALVLGVFMGVYVVRLIIEVTRAILITYLKKERIQNEK